MGKPLQSNEEVDTPCFPDSSSQQVAWDVWPEELEEALKYLEHSVRQGDQFQAEEYLAKAVTRLAGSESALGLGWWIRCAIEAGQRPWLILHKERILGIVVEVIEES